jgi:hypothetical protein
MFRNDLLLVFDGVSQAGRRIGRCVGIAKVDPKLVRVLKVPLAAAAEGLLQKLVVGQFPFLAFLLQLLDFQLAGLKVDVLVTEPLALRLKLGILLLQLKILVREQLKQLVSGK